MTARVTREDIRNRSVITPGGCWEYQGKPGNKGGYVSVGGDWAHRTSYRLYVGAIPDGLEIDHLCRNVVCVNPSHLEPVTHAENMRRAAAARPYCGNGHPWNDENTRINRRGFRDCRSCGREKERRRKERIRQGLASYNIKPEQHGTDTGYQYGCRCEPCRRASRANTVRKIAERGFPPVKAHQHGTRTGYGYGCRCDLCRACQRDAQRKRRAQQQQLSLSDVA